MRAKEERKVEAEVAASAASTLPARIRASPSAIALALGLGAVGGVVFWRLALPLPWMLGAMTATTVAALGGAPVAIPGNLRLVLIAVLGVMLGSSFSPALVSRAGDWLVSIAAIAIFIALTGLIVFAFLYKVAKLDLVTAYFTAMPGGLNEMVMLSGAYGGDERTVALAHAWRLSLAVFAIAFWFQLHEGYVRPPGLGAPGPSIAATSLFDLVVLTAAGTLGVLGGRRINLPAAGLTGPMIVSALVHVFGVTEGRPPFELVIFAQIGVGAGLGCRFAGARFAFVARAILLSTVATALMLAITALCAMAVHLATGLPVASLVLAYSPGGFAEMSLIAIVQSIDPAFVATHQLLRIALVVFAAQPTFKMLRRRRS